MGDHYVNLVQEVTEQCNLQCDHCFGECGPQRQAGRIEDLILIAGNYPKVDEYYLEITGGEPFANKELLYAFLEHLQDRRPANRKAVIVHSNGLWIRTREQVRHVIEELGERGVHALTFLSNDRYHRKAGLDTSMLMMAREVAESVLPGQRFVRIGPELQKATPIGRARRLVPEGEWDLATSCWVPGVDFETRTELYLRPDGVTGLCQCWVLDVTADMRSQTYEEVVAFFKSHALYVALRKKGVVGLAEMLGMSAEEAEAGRKRMGDCYFCADVLHRRA